MDLDQKSVDPKSKEKMHSREPFFCFLGRYVNEVYHYNPHWHDFTELLFVRKGYLRTKLRNIMLTIDEGELLVVMPGELHSFENDGDGILEYVCIQIDSVVFQNAFFDSKELSMIFPYFFSYRPPRSYLCDFEEIKKAHILPLINNIYSEIQKKELGYSLSIRGSLLGIFVWLLRRWNMNTRPTSEAGNLSNCRRMQPVLNLIKEQYQKDISTGDLAEKMAMSVPHFCRLFKKMTGYSFRNYLRSLRIVEAIKLLLSTDNNICQIASLVGYNNVNFFIRVFKEQTGITPFQYKKKYSVSPHTTGLSENSTGLIF